MMENDLKAERERRFNWIHARLSVIEDALQVILRRLGAPDEMLRTWRGHTLKPGHDNSLMYSTMNEILDLIKPPPKR